MTWTIERLAGRHDRTGFSCGVTQLDDFLTRYASQYEKRGIGRTHVLVRDNEPRVYGYYTLAAGEIEAARLPPEMAKRLPRHPIPTLLLGRLAVDLSVRGQGLGGLLLRDAFGQAVEIADRVGVFALVVDAIDEDAARFYERFGFNRLPDTPNRLLIPLDTVHQSGGG
jgi:GNAT superfamily N-acetyltransferase